MRENQYQAGLIKRIKTRFPGCMVLKNDPNYKQGIPDLTILYNDKWATLEVKKDAEAKKKNQRPNQDIYVNRMNEMSFSSFIFPENEEEVLDALERSFKTKRTARVSRSK